MDFVCHREWAQGESDSRSPACEADVLPFDYGPLTAYFSVSFKAVCSTCIFASDKYRGMQILIMRSKARENRFMLHVPFYANTFGDGKQCFQVAMQSVIKYFLHRDVPVEYLDSVTGRTAGHQTWTPQIVPALHDLGLKVHYYTKTDPKQLLDGEKFIRSHYGRDAKKIISLTDIPVLVASAKKLIRYGIYEVKVPTALEIHRHIIDGHLILALLDWNKVKPQDSFYKGHMGVVTGFDANSFYFHHSGASDPTPNLQIRNDIFMSAWNANGTDNDLVVVYGKIGS